MRSANQLRGHFTDSAANPSEFVMRRQDRYIARTALAQLARANCTAVDASRGTMRDAGRPWLEIVAFAELNRPVNRPRDSHSRAGNRPATGGTVRRAGGRMRFRRRPSASGPNFQPPATSRASCS